METGDGLLARLVPTGPMGIDDFASLCAAAQTHGNGLMEITARGSLQVRGLTPETAPIFARSVEALDIKLSDGLPVLVSPLATGPNAPINAHAIAVRIREMAASRALTLAPKVSVVVDGGGPIALDDIAADIRLQAIADDPTPRVFFAAGGDAQAATPLGMVEGPEKAAAVVTDLLAAIAAYGPTARAGDILAREGIAPFLAAAGNRLTQADALPARPPAEIVGLHRLVKGLCAIGIALPFGQAHALDLIALLRMARANGAAWTATAPQRTLLLGPVGEMTAFSLGTAADTLGFIVDARDARRRVVACAGAPACASGFIRARTLAAAIARALPASEDGVVLHVSGCAKGCAHPGPAPLTIVGTEDGCGILHNASARTRPEITLDAEEVVVDALRRLTAETADA
jgi:precorrin-3B synthase